MIIKELLAELETRENPAAKALYKTEGFKVLVMAFKNGMILKEHKANVPTKLVVLNGKINYKSDSDNIELSQYEEFEIPVHDVHMVIALEDSLCILIQG